MRRSWVPIVIVGSICTASKHFTVLFANDTAMSFVYTTVVLGQPAGRTKHGSFIIIIIIVIVVVVVVVIIIIIINPSTARVVGAPQMILQPVFSIFPCSPPPSGTCRIQACLFPDVVFPPLPLSALSSSPFHCALQDGFGQT